MTQANRVAIVFFMKSFLSFRIQLFRQKPWEYFAPFSFCFVSSRLVRIPFYSIIKSKNSYVSPETLAVWKIYAIVRMNVILRKMYHFTAGRSRLRSIHTKTRDCSKFRFLEHSREQKPEVYAVTKRKRFVGVQGAIEAVACTILGSAQDYEAMTGVTVLLFDHGAKAGIDISGGGPASRETPLTSPITANNPLNAIVLSGGSAFGLATSDGVMRYLEEHGIGYETGFAKVPLVCQSCIYDLSIGRSDIRPDAAMGYAACQDAEHPHPVSGILGGGTGDSVGKIYGRDKATKTGLGMYAVSIGNLKIAAVVILNAFGDVFNPATGEKIAAPRKPDGSGFFDTLEELYKFSQRTDQFQHDPNSKANTTIGAIITNGAFSKAELSKIASMARSGYARCINPVGTMADGDSIYAASIGTVEADLNVAGTLAAEVMAEAIQNAVKAAR